MTELRFNVRPCQICGGRGTLLNASSAPEPECPACDGKGWTQIRGSEQTPKEEEE